MGNHELISSVFIAVSSVRVAIAVRSVTKGFFNGLKGWFGKKGLTASQQKAIRTLEKRIAEHKEKLNTFKKNPTVRPGMENMSKKAIEKQQRSRIEHLEKEIKTFKDNIGKILRGK